MVCPIGHEPRSARGDGKAQVTASAVVRGAEGIATRPNISAGGVCPLQRQNTVINDIHPACHLDRGCSSLAPLWRSERSEYGLSGVRWQWGEATSIEVALSCMSLFGADDVKVPLRGTAYARDR